MFGLSMRFSYMTYQERERDEIFSKHTVNIAFRSKPRASALFTIHGVVTWNTCLSVDLEKQKIKKEKQKQNKTTKITCIFHLFRFYFDKATATASFIPINIPFSSSLFLKQNSCLPTLGNLRTEVRQLSLQRSYADRCLFMI